MILLSFNGEYSEEYRVIGVFDNKGLALGNALKDLREIRRIERKYGNKGVWKVDKKHRRLKWCHNFYQLFEFKEIKTNESV